MNQKNLGLGEMLEDKECLSLFLLVIMNNPEAFSSDSKLLSTLCSIFKSGHIYAEKGLEKYQEEVQKYGHNTVNFLSLIVAFDLLSQQGKKTIIKLFELFLKK